MWQPTASLNLDHVPILINLHNYDSSPSELSPRLYSNFEKADWDAFEEFVYRRLTMKPERGSCSQGEKILRVIISEASSLFISQDRSKDYLPNLSEEARTLIGTRDQI